MISMMMSLTIVLSTKLQPLLLPPEAEYIDRNANNDRKNTNDLLFWGDSRCVIYTSIDGVYNILGLVSRRSMA